jgi:phosphohistidine phosphatase
MNLFILRHGLAVEPGSAGIAQDSDRPLIPEGERKLRRIADALEEMDVSFDWILSSPYVRARQTAEIIAESLRVGKKLEVCEHLTPAGSVTKLVELIDQKKPVPENALLVGHEPYLSELISLLLTGDSEMRVVMKKGGVCKLTLETIQTGQCATMEWLLTPKQLCLMA